jgi:flavin reductase (DIM6/NTAB) family NADH-FMN oxidoreductase RutF
MHIDFARLSPRQVYHTMTQTLIPRPIAWVLSDNGDGGHNLAPFSYFMPVSGRPPLLAFSIGHKPDGSKKDTWRNIEERDVFVVHIAHRGLVEQVTASAATLPHGESEVSRLGIGTVPFPGFPLPRVEEAKIAYACRRQQIVELGDDPQGVVVGRIEAAYLDDAVARADADGNIRVDAEAVDPLGRLGGSQYALFGGIKSVPRPD